MFSNDQSPEARIPISGLHPQSQLAKSGKVLQIHVSKSNKAADQAHSTFAAANDHL